MAEKTDDSKAGKDKDFVVNVDDIAGWRSWLDEHHDSAPVAWLVFKKKSAGPVPFDYQMALDEALCYGWVDSLLKSIDEESYMRKFNPRKAKSTWSEWNKKHIARLEAEGRMKAAGIRAVEAGKKSGMWDKGIRPLETDDSLPAALLHTLQAHPAARACYFELKPREQKRYNIWINMAKRPETIQRRVDEAVSRLSEGLPLGLK